MLVIFLYWWPSKLMHSLWHTHLHNSPTLCNTVIVYLLNKQMKTSPTRRSWDRQPPHTVLHNLTQLSKHTKSTFKCMVHWPLDQICNTWLSSSIDFVCQEAVFMGNGEQYIWKPPEEDDIITLHPPPLRGENGQGHPSPPTAKEVCVYVCVVVVVSRRGLELAGRRTDRQVSDLWLLCLLIGAPIWLGTLS